MIDIYFVEPDGRALEVPEYPNENNWLGSIDLDEHQRLLLLFKRCELKGISFPYFEDSLLNFEQVRIMSEIFDEGFDEIVRDNSKTIETYEKFKKILSDVLDKKAAMIGFCD